MPDNTVLNSGTGGDIIATDDIGGVKHQRVKVEFGVDGSATDVSAANPLPTDPQDRALRDNGKIDIAGFDVALPAGTNNIGDVDVLSLPPIPAGNNNIGDVDIASGPTGASALQVQGAAAHDAPVAGNPVLVGAYGSSSAPIDASANGDAVRIWADLAGRVQVGDGGQTLSVDDGGGSLTVDGQVDVSDRALRDMGKIDIAAFDVALPAGTNNIGDVDVLSLPAIPAGNNNIGDVDIASGPAGTSALQSQGSVAHDAAVSTNNPHLIAARANANEPTAVSADGDVTHLWADLLGRLVVLSGHPSPEPPVTVNGSAAGVTVIAAPGAGLSLYICKGSVHNSAATENIISLREGSTGTIRWTANCAADGGGSVFDFGSRGWKLPANTALVADIGSATGYVNITEYYIAP